MFLGSKSNKRSASTVGRQGDSERKHITVSKSNIPSLQDDTMRRKKLGEVAEKKRALKREHKQGPR